MSKSSNDETQQEAEAPEWTTSERHRLLQAGRRRHVLDVLADEAKSIELEELAAVVAARENDVDDVEEMTVKLVAASLHHAHLPKMANAGVIDYEREENRVIPNQPSIDALTPYDLQSA